MSKLVVIRRCATIEEAFVVDNLLQDGGFLSSTPVRYHAQNAWLLVPAFEGVPVFVPEAELFPAAEYLIEMRASAKERLEEKFGEIDPTPWKRRPLRRWGMLIQQVGGVHLLMALLVFSFSTLLIPVLPSTPLRPFVWLELNLWYGLYVLANCMIFGLIMFALVTLSKRKWKSNLYKESSPK